MKVSKKGKMTLSLAMFVTVVVFFLSCSIQEPTQQQQSNTNSTTNTATDNIVPYLSVSVPVSNATVGLTVNVSGSATDNVVVKAVYVTADGLDTNKITNFQSGGQWTTVLSFTTNGSNTIRAYAEDSSGNKSEIVGIPIIVDDSIPSVSINSPLNGMVTNQTTLTVTGAASVGGTNSITNVTLFINGSAVSISGITNWSATASVLNEGTNQLVATAYADNGKSSVISNILIIDTTGPVVSISSPINGAEVSKNTSVSGTVSDSYSGISKVYVTSDTLSTTNVLTGIVGGNYTTTLSNLTYGSNIITVLAEDSLGNIGSPTHVTVVVAAIPVLSFIFPTNSVSYTSSTSAYVSGTATVDLPNQITNVSVLANGVSQTVAGVTNWIVSNVALVEGTNTLVATAYADNGKSSSVTNLIIKDTTGPDIVILSPANYQTVNAATITVSGTVSDLYSPVFPGFPNQVSVNGNYISDVSVTGNSWSVNVGSLTNGTNSITVSLYDNLWNVSDKTVYVVASIPPTVLNIRVALLGDATNLWEPVLQTNNSVYLVGALSGWSVNSATLSDWNPVDPNAELTYAGIISGHPVWSIELVNSNASSSTMDIKFLNGTPGLGAPGWSSVEKCTNGADIANRTINFAVGTTNNIDLLGTTIISGNPDTAVGTNGIQQWGAVVPSYSVSNVNILLFVSNVVINSTNVEATNLALVGSTAYLSGSLTYTWGDITGYNDQLPGALSVTTNANVYYHFAVWISNYTGSASFDFKPQYRDVWGSWNWSSGANITCVIPYAYKNGGVITNYFDASAYGDTMSW